ncbi:MAG: DUF2807 domain-containing protein [Rikenellaceae bacterium]|nr:DUF2807 domain-containing protein [Rikenellaceae bacterium]
MKRIYLILIAILVAAQTALAIEPAAEDPQTPDEIRAAAREQVISSLNLSKETRKKFEPIYDEYRAALTKATRTVNEQLDEATPLNGMKINLMSVAATAQVKLDYIDRFAEVLSSAQIHQLYNSEGSLAWTIRRVAGVDFEGNVSMNDNTFYLDSALYWQLANESDKNEVLSYVKDVMNDPRTRTYVLADDGKLLPIESVPAPEVKQQYYRLNGKRTPLLTPTGQIIEQDYGKVVNYHTLRVDGRIKVIIDPSVSTLKVRCDRAFMDIVKYNMRDGELSLSLDHKKHPAWTGDMKVEVYLPVSSHLSRIYADNTASVQIKTSLRTDVLTFDVNNRASVSATGHLIAQKVTVNANGYSKFDANVLTTNRDGSTMKNGMVLYNLDGRSEVSGTVVTNTFVGKANGYSDLNIGTSIHEARFVLNGRSKLRGEIGATTLRVELNGCSDVMSDQITFEKSAVLLLNGRSSITAKRMSAPQGAKFSAKLEGYSKMHIGSGRATEGFVTLSGRSEFNAAKFDVRNLTVVANDYSSADVLCSGKLRATTTNPYARINYSGNCTVESVAPSIQRK